MILTDVIAGRKKAEQNIAYDISGAVFYQETADVITPSFLSSLKILDNGTKLFYGNKFSRRVFRHDFGVPYDITTLTYIGQSLQLHYSMHGFWFSPDGLLMFTHVSNTIYKYTMSSPYNLSTSVLVETASLPSPITDFVFSPDGLIFYGNTNSSPDRVTVWTLGIAWNIATLIFDAEYLSMSGITRDINITSDGKDFFTLFNGGVNHLYLSTPFDMSTAILRSQKQFSHSGVTYESVWVVPEVGKIYAENGNTSKFEEWNF